MFVEVDARWQQASQLDCIHPTDHSAAVRILGVWQMVLGANVQSKKRSGECQLNFPMYSFKSCVMILSIKPLIPTRAQGE